jgi:hypothetical protein
MPQPKNKEVKKLRIEEIRAKLPAYLRRDTLGAPIWNELGALGEGDALELPGRGPEARRIGRAVARFARERGWELRVFSADGNCYVVRIK